MAVSKKLIHAIKLSETPAYRIAWAAGLTPSTLSKLLNGIERPKSNDRRVISVGALLGLRPEECFENEPVTTDTAADEPTMDNDRPVMPTGSSHA